MMNGDMTIIARLTVFRHLEASIPSHDSRSQGSHEEPIIQADIFGLRLA
jgi:hypothetical protein